ncbi:MAG: long-chain fatty acid--CoA ligase [Chlorobiota bacterium]|nr:MAG: long-chain fatty acid--CoA ligase [Chlorobiota bacterium]
MQTIGELFVEITRRYMGSGRPAYMRKEQGSYIGIGYDRLHADVLAYALALDELGLEAGDRVGILSENRYEWVITDFAVLLAGGVDVPMFPSLVETQVAYILNHSQSVLCAVSSSYQLRKLLNIADRLETLEGVIVFDDVPELPERLRDRIKVYRLRDVFARGLELQRSVSVQETMQLFLNRTRGDDLCTIIYTSGTTGTPKGVMLTHRNILSNVEAARSVIAVDERDVFLSYLPMCHSYERTTGFYTAFASGGTTAFAESLETVRTNLREVRPTVMTSVPQLFERMRNGIYAQVAQQSPLRRKIFEWAVAIGLRRLREHEEQGRISAATALCYRLAERLVFRKIQQAVGGRLRFFVSGGGPLAPEIGRFFWAIGLPIIEGYGLTEASPILTVNRLDDNEFGTVGKPIPGVEIRIDDSGEILARGPNIMRGYWRDPEETRAAIDAEGWLHTGDAGCWTARGNLKITDRIKNLIVTSGGKNVAPQVVESALKQWEVVAQVVVIGDGRPFCTALIVPNEEALRAFLRAQGIDASAQLAELCKDSRVLRAVMRELKHYQRDLAKYERVRRVALLPEPLTIENGLLTPTLKVKRKEVLARFADQIERLYSNLSESS